MTVAVSPKPGAELQAHRCTRKMAYYVERGECWSLDRKRRRGWRRQEESYRGTSTHGPIQISRGPYKRLIPLVSNAEFLRTGKVFDQHAP
ncbi:hypothetical protein PoB_005000000 [Plakobranchus ocellatus]|uniref:Uncharacterized protein n=1 Tax=Plakobranchus ocellatus TaxID=259542 RepID=A0AAV4BVX8_9GAST|nr:hypothetical protein PoB_005000000 [Plakobranchus ocellatus]